MLFRETWPQPSSATVSVQNYILNGYMGEGRQVSQLEAF